MSAILNTLKKLEEEKSVFEQSLDVQDLALHNEFGSTSAFVQVSKKRNNLILIASISIFLIISISLFFYFKSTQTHADRKLVSSSFFSIPKSSDSSEVKLPKGAPVSGISMNQILVDRNKIVERESTPEQPAAANLIIQEYLAANPVVQQDLNIDDVSNQAKIAEIVKLISSGGGLKKTLTQPLNSPEQEKQILNQSQSSKVEIVSPKIRKEINISEEDVRKTNEEILSLIGKKQIDETEVKVSSRPLESNPLNIPSLKLKGIIYFTEGNPANYIFVSSQAQNNVKLKVGESIMGARLQSIKSSRAIFTKDGKTGFVEMGQ